MGGAEHGRKRMKNFYRYPNRDAVKNYFPLPNEIFMLDLSAGEIAVYAYLLYREDRKTFRCYPSYKTIGNAVGMSRNTVKKYVDGLIEKRLIEAEPTQITTKHGRRNGNLCYTVRPIEEAIRYHFEQQLQMLSFQQAQERVYQKLAEYDRKYPKKAI